MSERTETGQDIDSGRLTADNLRHLLADLRTSSFCAPDAVEDFKSLVGGAFDVKAVNAQEFRDIIAQCAELELELECAALRSGGITAGLLQVPSASTTSGAESPSGVDAERAVGRLGQRD